MGSKTDLLKQILELKLKKATDATKVQIQKLQQKVDELTESKEDKK